jgi:phosphoribosylformylglycinamidine synthase
MPHNVLLDPQGKAVLLGLKNLQITTIQDVRIGKNIVLHITANTENEARTHTEKACNELLANAIMEFFEYDLVQIK